LLVLTGVGFLIHYKSSGPEFVKYAGSKQVSCENDRECYLAAEAQHFHVKFGGICCQYWGVDKNPSGPNIADGIKTLNSLKVTGLPIEMS
jgi:hypothetical protein